MRKFILVAALVLVSAAAQAGVSRGLTVASSDEPQATDQAKPVETPTYVARPAAVTPATQTPAVDAAKPLPGKDVQGPKAPKPKHRRGLTQAPVLFQLHRPPLSSQALSSIPSTRSPQR